MVRRPDLKENRAVNELKASQGKRVASTVAYGYKKSESDREQWIIDEPAAEVVRKIYALFLGGKGPLQIAKQLEAEKVLTPTAYFHSVGKKTSNPVSADIYGWNGSTVTGILYNRQYTGCTVNGKSSTVSYKVHKVIEKPKEEYQIIPNTQEAIIEERVWLRVQELRDGKRTHYENRQDKPLFRACFVCRLRSKASLLRLKVTETQSGIFSMRQLQERQRKLLHSLYP